LIDHFLDLDQGDDARPAVEILSKHGMNVRHDDRTSLTQREA
jgi:hypothetical protein